MNLQDITLQSPDGILVATNTNGHLVYPMLHLDRQPTPDDAQGFDRVLVFVDGDERKPVGGQFVFPLVIHLNEDNGYSYPLCIHTEHEWSISGVQTQFISIPQLTGTGDVRLNVGRNTSLGPGTYETEFHVTINDGAGDGDPVTVQVILVVSTPLQITNPSNGNTARHEGTIWIHLGTPDFTQTLTLQRDREWTLEPIGTALFTDHISVTPSSGNSNATLTVTSILSPAATEQRRDSWNPIIFRVVSYQQWVEVRVTYTIPAANINGEFVDPRPGEDGVTGTEDDPVYIYI